ncbi:hypothetical protein BT96DRAFT_1021438 [Gymnopus androsaceus JB14]|uniref:Glutamate/phenylalanine/leucine/valine/L-tryptophan dehydrogenase C-terminal domain-containing protein n=1 Tax=Gymnopus androsaceus JB14 TaxID=1447944 RepID=A0A6A4HD27_9AGAR|nr:hypothetical protein BT96DRAFT_1021438 [Gymnopus androsaceus JB14]
MKLTRRSVTVAERFTHLEFPLPNELSATVLLSKRPWVVPSQRRIFEKLELDGHALSLQNKSERLIAIFDEIPHLASGSSTRSTKCADRGPDGDLGSNEILLKTVAIIDGSGVLVDPAGLNRKELDEVWVFVKIEEQDVKLPFTLFKSGEIIFDGIVFRNGAHLRFKADLFMPCGRCHQHVERGCALRQEGKPHFKYIVKGANLFLTQQAASRWCNEFFLGSPSRSRSLNARIHRLDDLQRRQPSEFYQRYVKDIQAKITENATAEFQCLWKEHTRLQRAKPGKTISDELSSTLNNLQAGLECSDLFEDVQWGDEEGDTQDAG